MLSSQPTIIEEEVNGDVYVARSSQYNNLNAERVILGENIMVRLFGVVRNKLVIGKGTRVYFHGTIAGIVENLGGELYKY